MKDEGQFIVAIDAGGTMTDCILVDETGHFTVGKALTNRDNEAQSYMGSVEDTANYLGLTSSGVHSRTSTSIYTGTAILNTILTATGSKVGLIVTRGFEDMTVMEGGLTWLGEPQEHILHQQLRRHTTPLVDPSMVYGVSERITGGSMYDGRTLKTGEVVIPLNESELREAAVSLLNQGAEVIGILFINSFVNPSHELKAKKIVEEIIQEKGLNVPVNTSYEVAPVIKENNRLKSLLFQCFAAEKTRTQLRKVENVARDDGYEEQLYTILSYGGAVNIEYPRLYETIISGPIGGLMGANVIGKTLGLKNLVTADMGGTSFDVGLLVDNIIQVRKTADFARHRLATPMVAIDSIGSGAGSVVKVDDYNRIHIGPESAGYHVGICYEYPELTVTDINVALGYVDPNYFLGGKIKLNRERALAALEERIARPLGLDPYQAGQGVLDVIHSKMRDLLRTMIIAKGYNPSEFTALCYGGAGPVHMRGFTDGIGLAEVITVPWAAGFSAYGAACAENFHRYEKSFATSFPLNMDDAAKFDAGRPIHNVWRELEDQALKELKREGVTSKDVHFRYGVYARYIGQLESFDTPLDFGYVNSVEDVNLIIDAFEDVYTKMYPEGARFPDGGYAVTEVYLHAIVPKPMPKLIAEPLQGKNPNKSAFVESRQVYHESNWTPFNVWQMEELKPGNVVKGPAIIRDPMTTAVIPPGYEIAFDQYSVMHYRRSI